MQQPRITGCSVSVRRLPAPLLIGYSSSTPISVSPNPQLSNRRGAGRSIRLTDMLDSCGGTEANDIGEFLRHSAGMESLLNTRALQSFAPVESEPNTFRRTLHHIGFQRFQVTPVLDFHITPTCIDYTVEMLSCSLMVQAQLSSRMNSFQGHGGQGHDVSESSVFVLCRRSKRASR